MEHQRFGKDSENMKNEKQILNEVVSTLESLIEYFEKKATPRIQFKMIRFALGFALECVKKNIPKKPIFSHNLSDTLAVFHCECGKTIKVSHDSGTMDNNDAPNYCDKCGQKLDWSDKESEETKS